LPHPVSTIWSARSLSAAYPSACGPRAPSVSPLVQSSEQSRLRIALIFAGVSGLLASTVVERFVKSLVIVILVMVVFLCPCGTLVFRNAAPHGERLREAGQTARPRVRSSGGTAGNWLIPASKHAPWQLPQRSWIRSSTTPKRHHFREHIAVDVDR
jgi:hypothetical protein